MASKDPADAVPLFYDEARKIARRYLGRERKEHTLQPTALVHEAWLRLQKSSRLDWTDRTHGLALVARSMRQVLIDHGRGRNRQKRKRQRVDAEAVLEAFQATGTRAIPIEDLIALEDALKRLEAEDERSAAIVEMRYYAGLSVAETAECLGVSIRTVEGEWTHARAWLKRELCRENTDTE